MKPRKSNQVARKPQQSLDQGGVRSLDGRSGSPNPQGIPTEFRVFYAALQGFEQALNILLADAGGANRCDLARMLLPRLRQVLARLEGAGKTESDAKSLCDSCPQRDDCTEICEQLRAYLNGAYAGKLHGETTVNIDLDEIRARRGSPEGPEGDEQSRRGDRGTLGCIGKPTPFDPMEQFRSCWGCLEPKQREVVELHYGQGKSGQEIAMILNKAPSTICGLLKRARANRDEYEKRMRREHVQLLQELGANLSES